MIILDTNVLDEVMKPAPSARVMRWPGKYPALRLFTTTITQAEILYGVELLPKGKRRAALQSAVEAMFAEEFAGRILPFDTLQGADLRRSAPAPSRGSQKTTSPRAMRYAA